MYGNLYKTDDSRYPVKAFCMIANDSKADSKKLHKLTAYCCEKTIPHNLFLTKSQTNEIRIFFYPRSMGNFGTHKMYTNFLNVAFCELSGYCPIGDAELFEKINENYVLERFNEEIQNVCDTIHDDLIKIMKETE